MYQKVKDFVEQNNLIENGDKLIAGVSGGGDSVFLVYFLKFLQKYIDFSFVITHFNHKLRQNADKEEEFVKALASRLEVNFISDFCDVGVFAKENKMSVEMAARKLRYGFFNRLLNKGIGNKIAIAHNLNDSVETTLINFSRGSGVRGLKGISSYSNNTIRPLLSVEGEEIRDFLNRNSIDFVEDESNFKDCYLRNKVRKYLIPEFKKVFGDSVTKTFMKTTNLLSDTEKSLNYLLTSYLEGKFSYLDNCLRINKKKILSFPDYLLKEAVVYFVEKFNGSTYYLTTNIIEGIVDFFKGGGYGVFTPSENLGIIFIRSKNNLYLINKNFKNKSLVISSNNVYEIFPGVELTVENVKRIKNEPSLSRFFLEDLNNILLSPVIDGDYIEFKGKKRYNVVSLMKKRGLGAFERRNFPVLKRGNEILAIPFVCISDNLKKIQTEGDFLIEVYIRDLIM